MEKIGSKKIELQTIAFIFGFSIMALEISAARLFAPYFGTSALVWTNVIGVVLVTLSLGYWVGGRLAQKSANFNTLAKTSLVSAVYTACIGMFGHSALSIIENSLAHYGLSYILTGSLMGALLLFGPPIFFAGIASPYIVSLGVQLTSKVGNTIGTFYAISTIGGLLGTFLPTLVLIPTIGTIRTIYLCAFLFAVSALLSTLSKIKPQFAIISIITLATLVNQPPKPIQNKNEHLLASKESTYQYIQITEDSSGSRYLKFDSGLGIQSVYKKGSYLSGFYYDAYSIFPSLFQKEKVKVLILGFAGGTIARQLTHFYPEKMDITGVELDKEVLKQSERFLGLERNQYKLIQQDARLAVHNTKEKFDIIIIDTYHNEIQIPWQMTTQEFWKDVADNTSDNGVILMNIAHLNNPSFLTTSIANTLATVFKNTYKAKPTPTSYNNTILIATEEAINIDKLLPTKGLDQASKTLKETWEQVTYNPLLPVLKDDNTSMEWLLLHDISL